MTGRFKYAWDWIVAYLIPRSVWAWWTREVYWRMRYGHRYPR